MLNTMPDALACLAASAAISVSDIPFDGPVSEVRVGKVDGKLVINPSVEDNAKSTLDMIIAASAKDIMMVEGEMDECSEAEMLEAIKFGHEAIKIQINAIKELVAKVEAVKGKIVKREYNATKQTMLN
jgi:polyribonucleotide nucleotidyltransferase